MRTKELKHIKVGDFIIHYSEKKCVIRNKNVSHENGHTHIKKLHIAIKICENITNNKTPSMQTSVRLLNSYLRLVLNDPTYFDYKRRICNMLDKKKNKYTKKNDKILFNKKR